MYQKNMNKLLLYLLLPVIIYGCTASSSLKTFVDPSFDLKSVTAVAIFPIRNVRLAPDESRELNRSVSQKFNQQNPGIMILGPAESVRMVNEANLTTIYNDFLVIYSQSGIPNTNYLKEIGKSLEVDAILQGEFFDISQNDGGGYGSGVYGKTSITIRYSLISTNGTIIWEASSQGVKKTSSYFGSAPPLFEAISIANERILSALPNLGKRQ